MSAPTEFTRKLGETVRTHRKAAGLTQHQLADMAGIGRSTVFEIEKGRSSVQIGNVLAVLSVLTIRVELSSRLETAPDAKLKPTRVGNVKPESEGDDCSMG